MSRSDHWVTGRADRGGPLRQMDCRSGRSHAVIAIGDNEQRTPNVLGVSAGPVEADAYRRPRGHRLAPFGVAVSGVERSDVVSRIRCGQRRHGAALTGQRNEQGLAPKHSADGVDSGAADQPGKRLRCHVPQRVTHGMEAVDRGCVRYRCGNPGMTCGYDECVPAGSREPHMANLSRSTPGSVAAKSTAAW